MVKPLHASSFSVQWPAPDNISAVQTTRLGGSSKFPFNHFNLALHVGDEPSKVISNRQQLATNLGLSKQPFWLEQVHGTDVVCIDQMSEIIAIDDEYSNSPIQADGSYSNCVNQVCAIMTADCLPILFCSKKGDWVAATHAGWRGLAAGIIQKTVASFEGKPSDILAWLGPGISQKHFEVGKEVREQFILSDNRYGRSFENSFEKTAENIYHADLYAIAKLILESLSISVYGGNFCSYSDKERFYSYRRDGKTGRMASLIWINKN